jgi:hypothetical protein
MKTLLPVGISGNRGVRLAGKELLILLALALLALAAMRAHASEPMTPAAVMARGEERFRTLQDYQCTVEMESRMGTKVETGSCDFWFKQPGMLRAKITGGKRKGSVVAVDGSGTIRAHQAGLFRGVVKKLKPSDSRLLTIRGSSLLNLGWGSFYQKYHYAVLRPSARVTLSPRDASASSPYQVEVSYPDQGKRMRETYSVDPQRWVMVEGELEEDGVRVEHLVFEDIKLDTGVEAPWFKL